jgi:hypothetical protein
VFGAGVSSCELREVTWLATMVSGLSMLSIGIAIGVAFAFFGCVIVRTLARS